MEHNVILDNMGGAIVMTCEELNVRNYEYRYDEIKPELVKDELLKRLHLNEEDVTFDLKIIDYTKVEKDYWEEKDKEAKQASVKQ